MALGLMISLSIAAFLIFGIVVLDRRDRAAAERVIDAADLPQEVPVNA